MTRDEMLDAVYDEVTANDTCVEDAVVSLLEEIVRLRGLVREAFREGFAIGWDDPGNRDYWPESEVSKKLEDA